MKGIDTPVLVDLLRGRAAAWESVLSGQPEELATTEINLFELETLARREGKAGLDRRLAAVRHLRQKVSVLAVDERASNRASLFAVSDKSGAPPLDWLVVAAAETSGCTTWLTTGASRLPAKVGRIRVVKVAHRARQNR